VIRTEKEYTLALRRIEEDRRRAEQYRASLEQEGLDGEKINRPLEPITGFHQEIEDEVRQYERARDHDIDPIPLAAIGRLLISIRIANGLSQRDLAERLDVHESVVSRDERNDYHGITVERAQRILAAFDGEDNMTKQEQSYLDRIVIDPDIMAGKPTVRGARIPVDLVLKRLSQDLDTQALFESYPRLTAEDVKACIAYAQALVEGEALFPVLA